VSQWTNPLRPVSCKQLVVGAVVLSRCQDTTLFRDHHSLTVAGLSGLSAQGSRWKTAAMGGSYRTNGCENNRVAAIDRPSKNAMPATPRLSHGSASRLSLKQPIHCHSDRRNDIIQRVFRIFAICFQYESHFVHSLL